MDVGWEFIIVTRDYVNSLRGFVEAYQHSFGELKLILSKFGCTQHSANKFASAFVCTNFPVVANNAFSRCPPPPFEKEDSWDVLQ